jgi:glyoxylate reductase
MTQKKWGVHMTRSILQPALRILSKECLVSIGKCRGQLSDKGELLKHVKDKHAILCTLLDKIDATVMDAAGEGLRVISSYSTGVDHIDIKEATKRGIYVTCTGDVLTESTADLAFALIIATPRRIIHGHNLVTQKKWLGGWDPELLLGSDVHGKTIGILGLGRIGSAVARRARGFDMKIYYHNQQDRNIVSEKLTGARLVDFDNLMTESDFLSIHCTLNNKTYHLINETNLRQMKQNAFVINTARGQIINELHLIKALRSKWIAGAGLDVFETEPPLKTNPLLKMENVVLLPHIGSATVSTRTKMAEVAANNLLLVLHEKRPISLANPSVAKNNEIN